MENSQILGASCVFDLDIPEHQQKYITFVEGAKGVVLRSSPYAPNIIEVIPVYMGSGEELSKELTERLKTSCWNSHGE